MADEKIITTESTEGQEGGDEQQQTIPYARFKEVNDSLKAYKEFGSPAEIAAMAAEYNEVLEIVLQDNKKESKKDAHTTTAKLNSLPAADRARMLSQLEELVPGITEFASVKEKAERASHTAEQATSAQLDALLDKASKHVGSLAADYPEDTHEYIEDLVANKVFGSKKAVAALNRGDFSVIDAAFKAVEESFLSKHVTKKPAKNNIPGMLSNKSGLSSSGKEVSDGPLSEEKLAKMPAQKRKDAIGRDAYEFYNNLVNSRQ